MPKRLRYVLARGKLGRFEKVDRRKVQRLILYVEGKYTKEEEKYHKHSEAAVERFEIQIIDLPAIVSDKVNFSKVKKDAQSYQEYRQDIKSDTGQDIYGKDFRRIDSHTKIILDNVRTKHDRFNGFTVCYLAKDNEIHFVTVTFVEHKYYTFEEIYRDKIPMIMEAIRKMAAREDYPAPVQIVSILLRDDISREGKIVINGADEMEDE